MTMPDGIAGRRGSLGRMSADSWHLQPFLNGSWDCISIGSLVLGLIFNFEAPFIVTESQVAGSRAVVIVIVLN